MYSDLIIGGNFTVAPQVMTNWTNAGGVYVSLLTLQGAIVSAPLATYDSQIMAGYAMWISSLAGTDLSYPTGA